jgi:hypothetical protein
VYEAFGNGPAYIATSNDGYAGFLIHVIIVMMMWPLRTLVAKIGVSF